MSTEKAEAAQPFKPRVALWDHWVDNVEMTECNGYPYLRCRYCTNTQRRHSQKCRTHTIKCRNAPEEVRKTENEWFLAHKRKRPNKRPHDSDDSETEEEFDSTLIESLSNAIGDKNSKTPAKSKPKPKAAEPDAMSLLTNLLGMSNGTRKRAKPVALLTDEDMIREEKELRIKKARLEVRNLELQEKNWELQNDVYEQFSESAGHVLKELHQFLKSKNAESSGSNAAANVEAYYGEDDEHNTA